MYRSFLLSTAITAATLLTPAQAQELSAQDVAALEQIESTIITAYQEGEFDRMMDTNPPAMFVTIGEMMGTDADAARASMIDLFERGQELSTVIEYDLDIAARTEGRSITGRLYALVPSRIVLDIEGRPRTQVDTTILMYQDGDTWYWSRIDNDIGLNMLHETYVDLSFVEKAEPMLTEVPTE